MIFIGIDPGLTGAFAAIDSESQLVSLADLPVSRDARLAWINCNELTSLLIACRKGRPSRLAIERSHAMPGQGVSSSFMIGMVMGSILAACQNVLMPIELITPGAWKRAMGLSSDKSASLNKARMLFPTAELTRKKDHNRAEALLLAEYSRREHIGVKTVLDEAASTNLKLASNVSRGIVEDWREDGDHPGN